MQRNFSLPVIGVFTKQLDNWQSGSGHHLNEIMHRILDMNEEHRRFKFVFIHYAKSDNPIYQRVEELIIPRNPLAAAWILRKRRFDILHYTPLTIFAPLWGVRAKKVATIHGAEQLIVPQFYGTIEMLHERLLVPLYARRMDHILTVSHTSRGFFMGRYRVPGDRITVCPNAVSPLYRILPDASKEKYGFAKAQEWIKRKLAIEDPALFLENASPPCIIDEIQYAYIKMQVDSHRSEAGRFFSVRLPGIPADATSQ